MSSTRDFAISGSHKPMFKLEHYFDIYDHYLQKYKDTPVRMLEIGVCEGGSIDMWKNFLGPQSSITGIDVNPEILKLPFDSSVQLCLCDQEDKEALYHYISKMDPFDIILDDGGHTMAQQINSFEVLFPFLKPDGVYIVEDTHTSYWPSYDGGLRRPGTFIEFAKVISDYVNIDHFRDPDRIELPESLKQSLAKELISVTFYDSMVIFTKGDKTSKRAFRYYGNNRMIESSPLSAIS